MSLWLVRPLVRLITPPQSLFHTELYSYTKMSSRLSDLKIESESGLSFPAMETSRVSVVLWTPARLLSSNFLEDDAHAFSPY